MTVLDNNLFTKSGRLGLEFSNVYSPIIESQITES